MPPIIKTLPPSVVRLIDALSQLPGIGPKSASRLAYYLLRAPAEEATALADALRDLKARTRFCSVCMNITESDPCEVCTDASRDKGMICVVEEPLDVTAVERSLCNDQTHQCRLAGSMKDQGVTLVSSCVCSGWFCTNGTMPSNNGFSD